MKKLFMVSVFLVLTAVLFAQMSAGVLGGGNLNYIRGEDWDAIIDSDERNSDVPGISYGFGAFFSFAFDQSLTLRLDGMYQHTKSNFHIENDDTIVTLPVLDVNLSISYGISVGPGKLYGIVGPTLRYGLGDFAISAVDYINEEIIELDTPMTFGITGGAGYDFPLGPGYLFAEARYQFFFTGHWNDDSEIFGSKMFMDSVLASIGYGYSF